jgi:uncharacterized membrane protein YgaE (UPF0421/DUF939 family)
VFRFSVDGKRRYLGLGSATDITLKRARELAAEARLLRAEGKGPIKERQEKRAAEANETAPVITFRDVAEQYFSSHAVAWKSAKHRL